MVKMLLSDFDRIVHLQKQCDAALAEQLGGG
jgi:hypothetical protein